MTSLKELDAAIEAGVMGAAEIGRQIDMIEAVLNRKEEFPRVRAQAIELRARLVARLIKLLKERGAL